MNIEVNIICRHINGLKIEIRSVVSDSYLPDVMLEGLL